MTFVMTGEDLLMTPSILGDNLLTTLTTIMKTCCQPLTTTGDYNVMTRDDDTNDPCDDTYL
jgi:hypothetical protein